MKFDYTKYKVKGINRELVDGLKDTVLGLNGSSYLSMITAGVKLIVILVLMFIYKRFEDIEFQIAKQEYEQDRTNTGSDTIDDDLDGTRKGL